MSNSAKEKLILILSPDKAIIKLKDNIFECLGCGQKGTLVGRLGKEWDGTLFNKELTHNWFCPLNKFFHEKGSRGRSKPQD